ncbi:MAG: Na+/H+ antiporter NhaA [Emcibacteraceae bacterium]|nr:Na+/H+ antiporter NhaA [Emcibacteraceae bacterium]MDG1725856.1 Na+/H+ antiporter NhaA [Emcibacteraceae bacterium]
MLGLFIGKQVGVFGFCWIGVKAGLTELPKEMGMLTLYGMAALCGIGYTMSLFIGSLAFMNSNIKNILNERIGIIIGSVLSGIVGYLVLRYSLKKQEAG